jgi:hypothetical protein
MLRYLNGFDYWPNGGATANAIADGWFGNTTTLSGSSPGRFGKGLCGQISVGGVTSVNVYQALGQRFTTETCVIGQALFIPTASLLPGGSYFFYAYDAEGNVGDQIAIEFTEDGVIRAYRGGTLIATTGNNVFHLNEWFWFELKLKVHNTSGIIEVRINTVTVISFTGDTHSGTPVLSLPYGWDTIHYLVPPSGSTTILYMDDIYILDNTGSHNTDYLGNTRVNTQLTISAGDLTQFSLVGAAANWDAVNDTALNDSEYVYSGTVGQEDLYTMNPNVAAQNIFGVQVRGAYRQDDSTQIVAHNILKTGGTIYEGGDQYLSGSYRYYRDIWELNPHSGVGWVSADLNAIQAGTKVQSIG